MRRLTKTGKPKVLIDNADQWRDELIAVLNRGEKPTEGMKARYRHKDIKAALIAETDEKCAYCESKVTHVSYGDIEHIAPKSKVPAKAYEWDNLTLACDVCNGNKGDYYSDDPLESQENLVDPYKDDPYDHFLFHREIVTPRPDSARGYITEDRIKLTRGALMERRRERLDFLDGLVRAYLSALPELKPILLRDLCNNHLGPGSEFSSTCNAYINDLRSKGVIA